jgi:hypothetical protein
LYNSYLKISSHASSLVELDFGDSVWSQ